MQTSRSLCRLCAKPFESSYLLHIFYDQKSMTPCLDSLLKRYLPFPVSINDSLTLYVCKLCSAHVVRWHRFLSLCMKAQDHLKSMQDKFTETKGDALLSQSKTPQVDIEDSRVPEQVKSYNIAKKKKSNYCVARWCNNSSDMGIPFFRVPKERKRALQWLSAADRMDLADKDLAYIYRCYVCATHFAKEMFVNENCRSLNHNAIPTIFPKPRYARKIEEAQNSTETYPKHLQGVRLKNILPKSAPKSQEISTEGCSSSSQSSSYAPLITLLREPHQKQENHIQEVLFIRDSVPCQSNIQIISMFPLAEDSSETVHMEVQGTKGDDQPRTLTTLTNERVAESISSSSHGKVFESSEKELFTDQANTFICDNIQTESNCQKAKEISLVNESSSTVIVPDAGDEGLSFGTVVNSLPDSNMSFRSDEHCDGSDTVMVLDLDHKAAKTKDGDLTDIEMKNIGEDQRINISESLGLHGMPSKDSLSLNVAVGSSYSPPNPASLLQENLNFCSKESTNKDIISDCHDNIVGSQDFLLMHSSNDHIEQAHDHGFRQDKNLNNLCCTIVRETPSETSSVYGERSMMAEASVRAIECTSPNHGQMIEGLIDLDQFLDSG